MQGVAAKDKGVPVAPHQVERNEKGECQRKSKKNGEWHSHWREDKRVNPAYRERWPGSTELH